MTIHLSSRRAALAIAIAVAALATPPAFAVNKDMVELQTQIHDLQDAVGKLQQSNDERMGVLRDLVQQTADSVNKMSTSVDALQKQVRSQQEATSGKIDGVSGQVQSLNDSIDEIKARLNHLEKAMQDVQSQEQSINAGLQNLAPPAVGTAVPGATEAPPASVAPVSPAPAPPAQAPIVNRRGKPNAGVPMSLNSTLADSAPVPDLATPAAPASAPAASDLYTTALTDYMAAKYSLAASEFTEVIHLYPDNNLAGTSFYYQGEIDYRAGKYSASVKDYDHVIDGFPGNAKIAVRSPAQGPGPSGTETERRRHPRVSRGHRPVPLLRRSHHGTH